MATRKRASSRSGIVGRAVSAGRRALREAEKRVPPDVRRQVERRLKDADKTARAAIKQLQAQARKASTRADVNSVLKRIDGLTKQARQIAQGTGARTATPRRRAAATTSRPAVRTRKAASPARRKPAPTRKAAASRPAARPTTRRAPARRRAPAAEEAVMVTPVEVGEIEVIEVIEP